MRNNKSTRTLRMFWKGIKCYGSSGRIGVAYRLAIGEIEKAKWEELDLEEVSLILG